MTNSSSSNSDRSGTNKTKRDEEQRGSKTEIPHETCIRDELGSFTFHVYLNFRKLEVPFLNARQASIAVRVLEPDPILKPQDFRVDYSNVENVLVVSFQSIDDRMLRVGVSSVIDSIKTIIETMDVLDYSTQDNIE